MTEIKPGDIVKFTYVPGGYEHFFAKVREVREDGNVVGELHDRGTARIYDEKEIGFGPIYLGSPGPRLTKVEPEFGFVGPKPEPVAEPTVVLPLEVSESGAGLRDANGRYLGGICGDLTSDEEDESLAELVVRLLNEHFAAR